MKILYGTTNHGKWQAMKAALQLLDIELISLHAFGDSLPDITEKGSTPLENAEIKAKAYYEAFHFPVFSCDSGLYFDEVKEEEQPGVHVRRINGKELSDEEMIQYYTSLAKKYGGKITARYQNAIYFIVDENRHYSLMDHSIASKPFFLVSEPHEKRIDGFPLDALSIEPESGKYYYDKKENNKSFSVYDGFRRFFTEILTEK